MMRVSALLNISLLALLGAVFIALPATAQTLSTSDDSAHTLAVFEAYPIASKGYDYIAQREYTKAQQELGKALAVTPQNIDYRLQLANLKVVEGSPQKALRVIGEGLQLNPNHQGLVIIEDALRKQLGLPEKPRGVEADLAPSAPAAYTPLQQAIVAKTLDKQIAETPHPANCSELLVDSYNALTEYAALNAGYCALEAKQNAKAIKLFENASLSDDKAVAVQGLVQLGFIYAQKNEPEKAIAQWRKANAMQANTALQIQTARLLRESGEVDAAQQDLKSIIENPKAPDAARADALAELAAILEAQDSPEQAYAAGENILKLRPTAANYYAQALRAQGLDKKSEAINYLDKATALEPESYVYMYALAYAYRAKGQNKQAAETFEKALTLQDSTTVRTDYAHMLKDMGQGKKAAEQLALLQKTTSDPVQLDTLRRDVRDLSHEWQTRTSMTYRDGLFTGIDSTGTQNYDDSFQYGAETTFSPEQWQRHGRKIQLYGQLFASSDTNKLNWDADTTQGVVGARVAPLPNTDLYFHVARLIGLGEDALNDTQVRTSFSQDDDSDFNALHNAWDYKYVNVDVSYLLEDDRLFATSEGRLGRSYRQGQSWVLTPHAVLAGAILDGDATDSQALDIGVGLSTKLWFGETQTQYPDKSLELILQWRTPISSDDNKTGPFVRLSAEF